VWFRPADRPAGVAPCVRFADVFDTYVSTWVAVADPDDARGCRYDPVIPSRLDEELPLVPVKKVAVTLPEELFEMVERAREIEHRTRSEIVQEALRTHFGEPVYTPTEAERRMLDEALADLHDHPDASQAWSDVRDRIQPPQ
jgi:hypothetical protein